ncbi:DUF4393 domain-containing protein [Alistipes sp.]|uniref:DUF4393 domain-containing protein n=1 Tax=Alistipes sp. TaxID=1872444 RepID=UPI002595AB11|nr:DUF4393 domain-containing protein [uncultured Alistipes sp.]
MDVNENDNNMDNQVLDLVKTAPNVIGQIYQDLAQPGVQAVGKALGTVFEFSTSFLLPVKLLNEKFKLNFTKRLNEYKEKLEKVPEEKRCEVHPQIGTPIVEKLSYTTTDEIADLFTTLLANASNVDKVNVAHPSFVNMIERLSTDEARIIKYLIDSIDVPYCSFRAISNNDGGGFLTIGDHLTLIPYYVSLDYPQNINAYLSNLVSIGVLIDKVGLYKIDKSNYDEICEKNDLNGLKQRLVPTVFKNIEVSKSYYEITSFGRLFIDACIKK